MRTKLSGYSKLSQSPILRYQTGADDNNKEYISFKPIILPNSERTRPQCLFNVPLSATQDKKSNPQTEILMKPAELIQTRKETCDQMLPQNTNINSDDHEYSNLNSPEKTERSETEKDKLNNYSTNS